MIEEREIDLLDLLTDILSHWRSAIVMMLIGALLFSALDYENSMQIIKQVKLKAAEDFPDVEITDELMAKSIVSKELTESEQTAVLITIDDEEELESRKRYGNVSIVLEMDPYNIPRVELVYELALKNTQENHMVANMYQDVLTSSGLFAYIQEKTGIDAIAARELISISARTSKDYLDEYQKLIVGNDILKINVLHVNENECKKLAEVVKEYLIIIFEEITNSIGEHEIILISENNGSVMDMGILDKQVNYRNTLLTLEAAIAKSHDTFTDKQLLYYNLLTGEEGLEIKTNADINLKITILGAIIFAFLNAGFWMVLYILNDKIRVYDNLNSLYGINALGIITSEDKNKKNLIDEIIRKIRNKGHRVFTFEQSLELAVTAVKLEISNKEIAEICLLGCNMEKVFDICDKLSISLEMDNVKVIRLNNILGDATDLERVKDVKTVILVERAGFSSCHDIEEEIKLLNRQDITILGGIIVE